MSGSEPREVQYVGLTLEELHRREREYAERVVAERCAPLVEAIDSVLSPRRPWHMHLHAEVRFLLGSALAAYHAAQGAGRET